MKESIRTLAPVFNTRRMVKEYQSQMYLPAIHACQDKKPRDPAAEPLEWTKE